MNYTLTNKSLTATCNPCSQYLTQVTGIKHSSSNIWYLYNNGLPGACNCGRVHSASSPFVQNASVQSLQSSSSVNWSANHINCQEHLVLRNNCMGNTCNKKLIRPFTKRPWPQYHPFQAFKQENNVAESIYRQYYSLDKMNSSSTAALHHAL